MQSDALEILLDLQTAAQSLSDTQFTDFGEQLMKIVNFVKDFHPKIEKAITAVHQLQEEMARLRTESELKDISFAVDTERNVSGLPSETSATGRTAPTAAQTETIAQLIHALVQYPEDLGPRVAEMVADLYQ